MEPEFGIWNPEDAPSIALIKRKYKQAGIFKWNNARVAHVCNQIPCTVYEMAATAGCFEKMTVMRWLKLDQWPSTMAIHFRRIEQQVSRAKWTHEPDLGPGPEDIEMAKLIARGLRIRPQNIK